MQQHYIVGLLLGLAIAQSETCKLGNMNQYHQELMQAIWQRRTDRVQELLHNGADVNLQDEYGGTPIQLAIGLGWMPGIKLLLANGANVHGIKHDRNTPLMSAIMNRKPDVVDLLLESGVPVNEEIDTRTHETPLHMAAGYGDTKIVSSLLAHGAFVDGLQKKGTPLLCAAAGGHTECVKILIEHGADLNPKTSRGNNIALGLAVQRKKIETAEVLRSAGAKLRHEV